MSRVVARCQQDGGISANCAPIPMGPREAARVASMTDRTTRGCLFGGNADRPDRREGERVPEKQAQDNLTSDIDCSVMDGAPWVPIRAAVRVYPAMADGYRLSFFESDTVHPRFCWFEARFVGGFGRHCKGRRRRLGCRAP